MGIFKICIVIQILRTYFIEFLGHLLRDDLIIPVKMSIHMYVRPYVHMSVCTYLRLSVYPYVHNHTQCSHKPNSGICEGRWDIHDHMTFKVIRGQGQGHMRLKVSKMTIFKFYLLRHFSTNQKNSNGFWYYRVAQNKIPHQTICNIFTISGQILKILEAV